MSARVMMLVVSFFAGLLGQDSASADDPQDEQLQFGVDAEYCVTLHSPSSDTTSTLFCRYLVCGDYWILETTAVSPHWYAIPVYPYPVDLHFRCNSLESMLHDIRNPAGRELRHQDLMQYSNLELLGLDALYFAHMRARVWKLPESLSERVRSPLAAGFEFTEEQDVATPGLSLRVRTAVPKVAGPTIRVQQGVIGGFGNSPWLRTSELVHATSGDAGGTWLPSRVDLVLSAGRFTELNSELVYPDIPGSSDGGATAPPDEHWLEGMGLLMAFGKGGRHFELSWDDSTGLHVPKEIRVTLGKAKDGMFLRAARLLRSEVLSAEEFEKRAAVVQSSQPFKNRMSLLIDRAAKTVLGNDLRTATNEVRMEAGELTRQLEEICDSPRSFGERQMALQQLAMITMSTEPANSDSIVKKLDAYFQSLADHAVEEAVFVSALNLEDALLNWNRPDLLKPLWSCASTAAARMLPESRLRALIGVEDRGFGADLHVILLLNAIDDARQLDVDPVLLRTGLWQVSRILSLYDANKTEKTSKLFQAEAVYRSLHKVLQGTSESQDPALSRMSIQYLRLLETGN